MQVNITRRDITKGTATITFEHNGVSHTADYDLGLVVPGTRRLLEELETEFDQTMQDKVIDKLTAQIQREIEAGIITNPI
jgi:hypothetical protein